MPDHNRSRIYQSNRVLPENYLQNGYFDEHGVLRYCIFKEDAIAVARILNLHNTTATGLRNFYNRLQAIEYYLQQTNDFAAVQVKLLSFGNLVEYATARAAVPEVFRDFINKNLLIAQENNESFKGFLEHYKSVLAYAKTSDFFSPTDWLSGRGLPEGYLAGGYFNREGYLKKEVLVDWPQALINVFARGRKPMTMTALRRFYNKLKALDHKLKYQKDIIQLLSDIYSFERDAVYAASREVVPGVFIGFMSKNVEQAALSPKYFNAFVEHYQSIVAYGKGQLSEGGNR